MKYKLYITNYSFHKIEELSLIKKKRYQQHYQELYLFVLDYVLRNSTKTQNSVPLNRDWLASILGVKTKKASIIIKDLVDSGCIEVVKFAKFGENSTHYGIPEAHESCYSAINVNPTSTFNKVITRKKQSLDTYSKTLDGQLYLSYLYNINTCTTSTNKYVYHISPIQSRWRIKSISKRDKMTLESINEGDLFVKRPDLLSRVYTNFSILHRNLRKYLRHEGKSMMCVDVRNSQPLLAGMFIKDLLIKGSKPVPQEVDMYINRCELGLFYEDFMVDPTVDRKIFKQQFFKEVFFSRVSKRKTKLKKLFIDKYPEIYDIICEIKGGLTENKNCRKYAQFAVGLQRFEANIIYDRINLPMLREGFGCFNIYDSIVSHDSEVLEEAKRRIYIEFAKYGVTPTLNIEDFTKY